MVTYLHENPWNVQYNWRTRYKFWCWLCITPFQFLSLERVWTRLIFSITDVSHINMLPYQTPGISNQVLVFMRDMKMFASRMDILVKSAIFYNTPAEKWFGLRIFVPWNFLKNLISSIWDSFMVVQALHMTFSSVSRTDKMLTLNWSHSEVFTREQSAQFEWSFELWIIWMMVFCPVSGCVYA